MRKCGEGSGCSDEKEESLFFPPQKVLHLPQKERYAAGTLRPCQDLQPAGLAHPDLLSNYDGFTSEEKYAMFCKSLVFKIRAQV